MGHQRNIPPCRPASTVYERVRCWHEQRKRRFGAFQPWLQTTATTYTIWANNTGGSTSIATMIAITINDEAPGPFEYNPENNTLTNNTYWRYVHRSNGPVGASSSTSPRVAPSPRGGNGKIYGTPTELWSYMVWANNSGGSRGFMPWASLTINNLHHVYNGTLYTAATNGLGIPTSRPSSTGGP